MVIITHLPDQEVTMSDNAASTKGTKSTLVHEGGLMPMPVKHVINGCSELAEAFYIGCRAVKQTTAGIDEIGTVIMSGQLERLRLEYAPK